MDLELSSSTRLEPLASRYTCDGANLPFPIKWGKVPRGTTEVDLFILSSLPVNGKFIVAWALAGIKPNVHSVSSARPSSRVIVGRNSFGQTRYSLCPPKGKLQSYAVLVYPVPHFIPVSPGFDPEILVERELVHLSTHEGRLFLSYKRR